jgi:hypothetical protein
VVGIEDFALVQAQAFDDVLVGVGVDGFLEGLAQQVLAAFRRGDLAIGAEHDVVRGQGVGGDEETQVALDDVALVLGLSPLGSFQVAMSRFMFTSCGIQWFAQAAMYFSQAHLYLKGTSWLTSALALMMSLSG